MIDLHYDDTPNNHKIVIMLNEVGLDYRITHYTISRGDHLTPEFSKINPNLEVPRPRAQRSSGCCLESFAMRTASSVSLHRIKLNTGPNISSCAARFCLLKGVALPAASLAWPRAVNCSSDPPAAT